MLRVKLSELDSHASEAAELDPSRPQDLDPEAVYFYHQGAPMEWDAKLKDSLTQVAAAQDALRIRKPTRRKDGSVTPAPVSLCAEWLLRPNQGRNTLGEVLRKMKLSYSKRRTLQSLAGMYPGNAILYKWKLAPSPACTLCGSPAETMAHIQCICPALKEARIMSRIRAHHNLLERLWKRLWQTSTRFVIHREMTVESLRGIEAPLDCRDEWQRALDELIDSDMASQEEEASDLRKCPDGTGAGRLSSFLSSPAPMI